MHLPRHLLAATIAITLLVACDSAEKDPNPDPSVAPITAVSSSLPPNSAVCAPPYPAGAATVETVFCADPATLVRAPVIRVVDGDTIHVEIDGRDETVRFYGIDTPERGRPCFEEATERVRQLAGAVVLLRPDARDQDRYDRLLRYVYTEDGASIDATLIAEGLARAWTDDGALRVPMIALEATATAGRSGCLWPAP